MTKNRVKSQESRSKMVNIIEHPMPVLLALHVCWSFRVVPKQLYVGPTGDLSGNHGSKTTRWRKENHYEQGSFMAPVEVDSLSNYLQGLVHPRWCGISPINRMKQCSIQVCPQKKTSLFSSGEILVKSRRLCKLWNAVLLQGSLAEWTVFV